MKKTQLFCFILFAFIIFCFCSCVSHTERPKISPEEADDIPQVSGQDVLAPKKDKVFSENAVIQGSLIIDENLRKTFPVFNPKDKNASDKAVQERLTDMANNLLVNADFSGKVPMPQQIQVEIVELDELNSFSAGNQTIFITRKMLDAAEDSDQVASIIAHELAHISLGHTLAFFDDSSKEKIKLSAEKCLYVMMEGYGDNAEFAADQETLAILKRSGKNPEAFVQFLRNIRPLIQEDSPDIASTHPHILQRIANIAK
ncbi:MAG: M48 family metallopeptidase [Spirochaetaceae bacterium]|nr:M48 family metallopeptidase [Spirochaetaceae bacterium]